MRSCMSWSCCMYSARRRNDASSVPVSSPTLMMLTYSGGKIFGWRAKLPARSRPPSRSRRISSSVSRSTALCVDAARPLMPRNSGMPDFVIVYICRENITRSAVLGLPMPSLRSACADVAGALDLRGHDFDRRDAGAEQARGDAVRRVAFHQAARQLAAARASGVAEDRHARRAQRCKRFVQQRIDLVLRDGFDLRHDRLVVVEAAGDRSSLPQRSSCRWRRDRARHRPAW